MGGTDVGESGGFSEGASVGVNVGENLGARVGHESLVRGGMVATVGHSSRLADETGW